MLLWHEWAITFTNPGRGTHAPIPPGPKRPPSRRRRWKDATAAVDKSMRVAVEEKTIDPAEGERLREHFQTAAEPPFDPDIQGRTFLVVGYQRRLWQNALHPTTVKLVRYWLASGGAAAIEALDASWRYGLRDGQLGPAEALGLFKRFRLGGRYARALYELRLLLARADPAIYDEAVAAARALWPERRDLGLRLALSFLLPTERDLAEQVADAMLERKRLFTGSVLLASSLADPRRSKALIVADDGEQLLRWAFGLINTLGEAALPPLMELIDQGRIDRHQASRLISTIATPQSAAWLAAQPESDDDRKRFFLSCPELALEHLPADAPLRDAVLRAHPDRDPNAAAQAPDEALPEPLRSRNAIKTRKTLPDTWRPYGELKLAGGEAILGPRAFERLGRLLQRELDGSREVLTPPLAEVREALDPDSADDFAAALLDELPIWKCTGKSRFVYKSLIVFARDRTVARLSTQVMKQGYADACKTLGVLAAIGTDAAMLRISYIATRGRGGIKRRAQEYLSAVARRRGLSDDQLADRLVPDLGLDPGGSARLDFGPRQFTVTFDEGLKPLLIDGAGKRRKSLPRPNSKDDPELAAAAKRRLSQLKKDARTLSSVQLVRLEQAMVRARRWTRQDFARFLAGHPLLVHLVRRLVWGVYGDSGELLADFRLDEQGERVDREDEPLALPGGAVGIAHPLDLGAEALATWGALFADYELIQPFRQLDRPVYRRGGPGAEALLAAVGEARVPGGRLLGLTSKGWQRGPIEDNGYFYSVRTSVGGLRATLSFKPGINVDGIYGVDEDQALELELEGESAPIPYSEVLLQLGELVG